MRHLKYTPLGSCCLRQLINLADGAVLPVPYAQATTLHVPQVTNTTTRKSHANPRPDACSPRRSSEKGDSTFQSDTRQMLACYSVPSSGFSIEKPGLAEHHTPWAFIMSVVTLQHMSPANSKIIVTCPQCSKPNAVVRYPKPLAACLPLQFWLVR